MIQPSLFTRNSLCWLIGSTGQPLRLFNPYCLLLNISCYIFVKVAWRSHSISGSIHQELTHVTFLSVRKSPGKSEVTPIYSHYDGPELPFRVYRVDIWLLIFFIVMLLYVIFKILVCRFLSTHKMVKQQYYTAAFVHPVFLPCCSLIKLFNSFLLECHCWFI